MVERASLCHDGGGASPVEAASSAFIAWHGHLCFWCLKHSSPVYLTNKLCATYALYFPSGYTSLGLYFLIT